MSYSSEHRTSKGMVGDGIGWRADIERHKAAVKAAERLQEKRNHWEELVKQGLAQKIVEQLPCRSVRIRYVRI